jgi:hypothetical protein
MRLEDFAGKHSGQIGWVFGSGPSLNFIDPAFFDGKPCFVTNYVGDKFGLKQFYVFCHYHEPSLEMAPPAEAMFVPRKEHGDGPEWCWGDLPNLVLFDTKQGRPGVSFDPFGKDEPGDSLVVGSTGLHGAMHLAAYMGCKDIVLVGADCGSIDGEPELRGYGSGWWPLKIYNDHLPFMKRWLQERYGCRVYSLNPFVNLNLEGHKFDGV